MSNRYGAKMCHSDPTARKRFALHPLFIWLIYFTFIRQIFSNVNRYQNLVSEVMISIHTMYGWSGSGSKLLIGFGVLNLQRRVNKAGKRKGVCFVQIIIEYCEYCLCRCKKLLNSTARCYFENSCRSCLHIFFSPNTDLVRKLSFVTLIIII